MRKLFIGIVVLVVLLATCYASLPWLVSTLLVPRLIEQATLDALTLEIDHPRIDSIHISRLHLEAAPFRLDARDINLSYNLRDLRLGRIEYASVATLVLMVQIPEVGMGNSDQAENDVSQQAPSETTALSSLLARVPAERISVEHLELAVPSADFLGVGNLSLDEAGLEARLTGVRPNIAQDLNAAMTMSRTGTLQILLEDPDPDSPSMARLLAEPEDTELAVVGDFSITGYGLELLQELGGIPQGTGTVSGDLTTRLPWPLTDPPSLHTLNATGQIEVDWSLADPQIELDNISASVVLENGNLSLSPEGETRYSTDDLSITGIFRGGTFTYRDGRITSEDARLTVSVETPDVKVLGDLNATLTAANQEYEGTFNFNGNADLSSLIALSGIRLEDYSFHADGSYALTGDRLATKASLDTGPFTALPFSVEHNLDSATGTLSFVHTQTIDEPFLQNLLPGWPAPYDFDGGNVDMSGLLTWGDRLTGSIVLRPEALIAHYDDYSLINVAGTLNLALTNSILALLPSTVTIEAIDIGTPLTNVALAISGSLDTLTIGHTTAELMGGSADIAPFDYEIDTGNAELSVALTNIDLAEVLALEGDNVNGTGQLSGTIPVALRGNALHIEGGVLAATLPGQIMLSPTLAGSIQQPGLDIALKALENFTYSALSANVDYDEKGNMLFGIRLEGSNPDLENGRPVHFNLNISENIPVLLKSLRLQDNFTKTLERRITQ